MLANEFITLVQSTLADFGLPTTFIQACTPPSHDNIHALMTHPEVDMILATGENR